MSVKKKLGMGIVAGALGLTLVGGGSYAAFNDVEEINNTFAAGTLDLTTNQAGEYLLEVKNMKPGDYFSDQIVLGNSGSLDINQVLASVTVDGWVGKTYSDLPDGNSENNKADFLNQFSVVIENSGNQLWSGSLNDLDGTNNLEVSGTDDQSVGLEAQTGSQTLDVTVTFDEDGEVFEGTRIQKQNMFQGEGAEINVTFEATQMPGEDRSND